MPAPGSAKNYKIQLTPERTLGPIGIERVRALVMKGRIHGDEPTSVEPFLEWKPFTSFSELGELLLKKMEQDQNRGSAADTNPEVEVATKTLAHVSFPDRPPGADKEEDESYGMPTLVDIPTPPPEPENPDNEKTMVGLLMPLPEQEDGATKMLSLDTVEKEMEKYIPPPPPPAPVKKSLFGLGKPIKAEDYVTETGKKRLLTRNTAALLAMGILAIAYLSAQPQPGDPSLILPRYHTFPYVEVNMPPRLGAIADPAISAELTEKGQKLIEAETPSAYILAIRKFFYNGAGKNPQNYDARALLASSYMRLSEIVPRDERLFETVDKLLLPGPSSSQWTPEYVVARAEYYQMLNRHDQAQEIVDNFLKARPTAELYYQKAKIAYERRELDLALNSINKSIPPEGVQKANPRHILLQAILLQKKGQSDAAQQAFKRLYKEHRNFGPGLIAYAEYLLTTGKPKEARALLGYLLERPYLMDRTQLAEAFVVAARTFETLKDMRRALVFANAAYGIHYNNDEAEDLLVRIKSKIPETQKAYEQIMQGRQREQAKQADLAQNNYIKALEENRKDPIPFLLLAHLYEEKGNIVEAIDRYQKALYETPAKPIVAALNLARIYATRFDFEKAGNMIKLASDMKRKRDQVLFYRGLVQLKQKRYDLAEPFLENALHLGSRFPELYIQMGDFETRRKNQKLAEYYYSVALRYEPYHAKAMLGVAMTRFHLDSPSRAISFLKDKLAAQPNSAAIMTNLAIIFIKSGDQDAARSYLLNAIRSDGKYADAFRLLGNLTREEALRQNSNDEEKKKSYQLALASYVRYSQLAPHDPEGYKAVGDLYLTINDLGAAAQNYYKVLELTPNYPDVRRSLAEISLNGNDVDKAMELLNKEMEINPANDAALVSKGDIYRRKGDFQAATKAYTDAARLNDKNSDALFGLGVVYSVQGSYDNALSLFGRVIKLDPLKAEAYFATGEIYQKQNNRGKAKQAFINYKGIVRDPRLAAQADQRIQQLSR
ncbi:MAG: tetratricopeptide repeat protein [Bacteriovoracia bacterium]